MHRAPRSTMAVSLLAPHHSPSPPASTPGARTCGCRAWHAQPTPAGTTKSSSTMPRLRSWYVAWTSAARAAACTCIHGCPGASPFRMGQAYHWNHTASLLWCGALLIPYSWKQNTSVAFFIQYGRGTVLGNVAYDTLTVGQPPVKITKQGVGLARDCACLSDHISKCTMTDHRCDHAQWCACQWQSFGLAAKVQKAATQGAGWSL